MGINRPDVRWVVHYDMPRSLESYYQESGRAGRDGDKAQCILYFGAGDIRTAEFLIQQKIDPVTQEPLEDEQRIARQQLRQVLNYAESDACRRAVQLRYFGEEFPGPCNTCDNCLEPRATTDMTTPAQQFLSCIARLAPRHERFGAGYLIEVLRGAQTERIRSRDHTGLSVYGIGKERSVEEWRNVARALVHQSLVTETQDGYSVLSLNEESWQVLRGERSVAIAATVKASRERKSATPFSHEPNGARRIEKWRRTDRARTGGDATDYAVRMPDGLGKSVWFDQKCRASPRLEVYESRVPVTMNDSCRRNANRASSLARFFPESPRCNYQRASTR